MKKRGVVLLITLSIIAIVSALIMQNLDNIDKMITQKSHKANRSEINYLLNNFNSQIMNLLNKEDIQTKIKEVLPLYSMDLSYQDMTIIINSLDFYDKSININKSSFQNSKFKNFLKENIPNYPSNGQCNDKCISNYKQLNYIITNYLIQNDDNEIRTLKDELTFFDIGYDDEGYSNVLECFYTFSYLGIDNKVRFVFTLDTKEVKEIEIWNE